MEVKDLVLASAEPSIILEKLRETYDGLAVADTDGGDTGDDDQVGKEGGEDGRTGTDGPVEVEGEDGAHDGGGEDGPDGEGTKKGPVSLDDFGANGN